MREKIRAERRVRLERFLAKTERINPPPHLAGRWIETLINLYLGSLRADDPQWPNTHISRIDALERSSDRWLRMYVHSPVQARVNAALKKWRDGYPEVAKKMLEDLASDQCGDQIKSEIQSRNASHRHKKGSYEQLLDSLYKANPDMGHKELERSLRKHVGKGVIHHIDDSLGEIVLSDGRVFKLSGLKDQLYKRRVSL